MNKPTKLVLKEWDVAFYDDDDVNDGATFI